MKLRTTHHPLTGLLAFALAVSATTAPPAPAAAGAAPSVEPARAGGDVDLAKRYRSKLDHEEGAPGRDWTCEPDDVWALESFTYRLRGELTVETGPATVVFGKHDAAKSSPGVVWAVVLPDEPAKLDTHHPGGGEHATSLFLRFHPSLTGKLFPRKTVVGPGPPEALLWARLVYQHKINAAWQVENMPVVPWKQALVLDAETREGARRMYMIDAKKKSVRHEDYFVGRTIPAAPTDPIEPAQALAAFDAAWEAFDREYAMFVVKEDVDWKALRDTYRPLAEHGSTTFEAAGAIALLLCQLEDLHVWVRCGEAWLPAYNRMRMLNANWKATQAELGPVQDSGRGIAYGRTSDDLGYVNVWNLSGAGVGEAFDAALEALADTRGLVLDLRFNGGGGENVGRAIAGRFVDQPRVYSQNRYRNGAAHDALGPVLDRTVEPSGPWRYEAPVACLVGRKTMSSAESLALMLAQCPQVTLVGAHTAGSSANPRRLELAGGSIVVNLPRWLDLTPEGEPIDAVGVAPDLPVHAPSLGDFSEREDPVMEAGLAHVRKQRGRRPGRR